MKRYKVWCVLIIILLLAVLLLKHYMYYTQEIGSEDITIYLKRNRFTNEIVSVSGDVLQLPKGNSKYFEIIEGYTYDDKFDSSSEIDGVFYLITVDNAENVEFMRYEYSNDKILDIKLSGKKTVIVSLNSPWLLPYNWHIDTDKKNQVLSLIEEYYSFPNRNGTTKGITYDGLPRRQNYEFSVNEAGNQTLLFDYYKNEHYAVEGMHKKLVINIEFE